MAPYLGVRDFWHGRKGRWIVFFLTGASLLMAIAPQMKEDHINRFFIHRISLNVLIMRTPTSVFFLNLWLFLLKDKDVPGFEPNYFLIIQ
jgi:hypothetical protein